MSDQARDHSDPFKKLDLKVRNTEELIDRLEGRRDILAKSRHSWDWQAKINLSFYEGYQYIVADKLSAQPALKRAVYNPDDPKARVQVTANILSDQIDRLVARILKGLPRPECHPVTLEEKDLSAARVGTRILASELRRMGMDDKLVELYYWVVPTGTGFFHTHWDPHSGKPIGYGSKKQPLYEGNVETCVCSPLELVFAPGTTWAPLGRWCIRTVALSEEEIDARWGKEVKDGRRIRTLDDELGSLGDLARYREEVKKYEVHQFWLRPNCNTTEPNGMVFTWSGKTVLEDPVSFPYEHNHLPFIPFHFLPPRYGWLGRTPVSDVIEIQQDYNHARSREADIRDRLVPKLIAAKDEVDPELYTDLVELIEFTGRSAIPPQMQDTPVNWMNMWEAAMQRASAEIGNRLFMNEAARGDLAGTSPGVTVLAQQEAAAEPLAIPLKSLQRAYSEHGWQHLMLVKQFWDEERVVTTWSEHGEVEAEQFSRADLRDQLDVQVQIESSLPKSKSGRIQLFLEFWNKGIITDPRLFTRLMDLPPTDILARTFDIDARHAERENGVMSKAKYKRVPVLDDAGLQVYDGPSPLYQKDITNVVPVEEWHNHEVHIAIHNDFRKTEIYESLGEAVRQAFDAHVGTHMGIMATQMEAQMAQAAQAQGGPSRPPSPPNGKTPSITDIAQIGGRPGRPGTVPGIPDDTVAASIGD